MKGQSGEINARLMDAVDAVDTGFNFGCAAGTIEMFEKNALG
jgi:hypothetical protein